jgi:transposase
MKAETAGWKRERLLAVKMGLEGDQDLEEISEVIGRARSTIQRWFDQYRQGGIDELLTRGKSSGAPSHLPPAAAKDLKRTLGKSNWRTMKEARRWLRQKHGVEASESSMYRYLKKAGGKLKVPRPKHAQTDEKASKTFKQQFYGKLEDLSIPPQRRVRLWVADEMRYGLRGFVRRVWGLKGIRPVVPMQQKYQWGYVYGALDCMSGAGEFLYTPTVNLVWTQQFLEQIRRHDADAEHVIVWDGAGFHPDQASHIQVPSGVHLIKLPPYSPELNPIEKLWDVIQDGLCNKVFSTLAHLEKKLTKELRPYWEQPHQVWKLLGDGYLMRSANAM